MKEIEVYADWNGLPRTMKMGVLGIEQIRGEEVFSLTFESEWLEKSSF